MKLICVFVFACAKIWFSHDAAHYTMFTNDKSDQYYPMTNFIGVRKVQLLPNELLPHNIGLFFLSISFLSFFIESYGEITLDYLVYMYYARSHFPLIENSRPRLTITNLSKYNPVFGNKHIFLHYNIETQQKLSLNTTNTQNTWRTLDVSVFGKLFQSVP